VDIERSGPALTIPTTGRFLQTDPIPGGSANNYDYCDQDSINCYDLTGLARVIKKLAGFTAWWGRGTTSVIGRKAQDKSAAPVASCRRIP
jgi:hypothetical protein